MLRNAPKTFVTGVGVGLPGRNNEVFSKNNIELILSGQNLITNVSEKGVKEQLNKNLVQKSRDGEEISFKQISKEDEVIRLSAKKGEFNLFQEYEVGKQLIPGFDITSSLAIAAGLEALKDAGIPLMREENNIALPKSLQDDTGVIFASTFPVLDSVLKEQRRFFTEKGYEFDRKFILKAMPLTHGHFAQIVKARGPNSHVNVACASTAQAIAIAQDWIRIGRCRRVVIIAADDASNDEMFQWVGSGFLAAGAASTTDEVKTGAKPFDKNRKGMILGMGAVGLVLESLESVRDRGLFPRVEVVAGHFVNSAYHATKMDKDHISDSLNRFLTQVEVEHGIRRQDIASSCVYYSHETYTPPQGNAVKAEIEALEKNFGQLSNQIIITNTKGFTGHPMGVGIEDVALVKSLETGRIPPVVNLKEPEYPKMHYSRGETTPIKFGLHFAAGFGSQLVYILYRAQKKVDVSTDLKSNRSYLNWIKELDSGKTLQLMGKTLILD